MGFPGYRSSRTSTSDFKRSKHLHRFLKAAARKADMHHKIFAARNYTRFSISRKPHSLSFIEFGILKGRESYEATLEDSRKTFFLYIDQISLGNNYFLRKWPERALSLFLRDGDAFQGSSSPSSVNGRRIPIIFPLMSFFDR